MSARGKLILSTAVLLISAAVRKRDCQRPEKVSAIQGIRYSFAYTRI